MLCRVAQRLENIGMSVPLCVAMDLLSIQNKLISTISFVFLTHSVFLSLGVSRLSTMELHHPVVWVLLRLNLLLSSSFSLLEHDGGTLSGTCGVI